MGSAVARLRRRASARIVAWIVLSAAAFLILSSVLSFPAVLLSEVGRSLSGVGPSGLLAVLRASGLILAPLAVGVCGIILCRWSLRRLRPFLGRREPGAEQGGGRILPFRRASVRGRRAS